MPTHFDGSEGTYIPLTEAQQMTADYRSSSAFPAYDNVKGFYLGKDKLRALMRQHGCKGLRIYLAYKQNDDPDKGPDPQIVVVGVDANKNDIVANNKILDRALPCPDECPSVSSGLDQ